MASRPSCPAARGGDGFGGYVSKIDFVIEGLYILYFLLKNTIYKLKMPELPMKLRNWIDINNLSWAGLSANPNAIDLLEKN